MGSRRNETIAIAIERGRIEATDGNWMRINTSDAVTKNVRPRAVQRERTSGHVYRKRVSRKRMHQSERAPQTEHSIFVAPSSFNAFASVIRSCGVGASVVLVSAITTWGKRGKPRCKVILGFFFPDPPNPVPSRSSFLPFLHFSFFPHPASPTAATDPSSPPPGLQDSMRLAQCLRDRLDNYFAHHVDPRANTEEFTVPVLVGAGGFFATFLGLRRLTVRSLPSVGIGARLAINLGTFLAGLSVMSNVSKVVGLPISPFCILLDCPVLSHILLLRFTF